MISSKVILYTSKTLKNGEHPIMIRLIKDRKPKYISTGISCSLDLWDFKENKPKKKHPNRLELELFIDQKKSDAQKIILDLENENKSYSSEQIKKIYKSETKKITVFEYFEKIIEKLVSSNKIGNANVYKDSKRALAKYRNGIDLSFSDINYSFLKNFEQYHLDKNVTGNSISVYLRTLRSVCNKAIEEGYCKRENYPFDRYKISKLATRTVKRALTIDQMKKIINLDIKKYKNLIDSKFIFLFSFYCRGMNFTDIATLKWQNIQNNRLTYKRAKTGKLFNIEVLEPAKTILNYYKKFTGKSKDNYVFFILNKETHVTSQQIDYRIEKCNKAVNKDLKKIANLAKIDFNLTTYVARHSYATILKRSGISTSIIKDLLGHDIEKTTQIYLDDFENTTLDEANRAILI